MPQTSDLHVRSGVDFSVRELTGALGDSITVLPLIVALAIATDISLPHVLIAFGIFQIIWGIKYGLPLSVEPMKALVALVIVGSLTYADLVAAGLVLGLSLLALGYTGTLSKLSGWLGEPVIRGVQLGVALLLLETGISLAIAEPTLAGLGLAIALVFIVLGRGDLSTIVVLLVGCAIAVWVAGVPTPTLPGMPPTPDFGEFSLISTAEGTVAQLAMTIGNAAVATSLLLSDYFDRQISPDELSMTMGGMTLAALPIGGIPMCHGSGGLAGKYAFGARTGGANIILGVIYLGLAFVAVGAIIIAFPLAILGILLVLIALELGRAAIRTEGLLITGGMGVVAVVTNIGIAFIVGILAWWAFEAIRQRRY